MIEERASCEGCGEGVTVLVRDRFEYPVVVTVTHREVDPLTMRLYPDNPTEAAANLGLGIQMVRERAGCL